MKNTISCSPEILKMMAREHRNEVQSLHDRMDKISKVFERFKELENTSVGSRMGSEIEKYYGAYCECLLNMKRMEEVLKETAAFLDATAKKLEPIGDKNELLGLKLLN